jgi:hypothetical protein
MTINLRSVSTYNGIEQFLKAFMRLGIVAAERNIIWKRLLRVFKMSSKSNGITPSAEAASDIFNQAAGRLQP